MKKTAIVYLYKENSETILNLDFFIKQSKFDIFCDYYLIINDHICSLTIPDFFNIVKKNNDFDFPSYKTFLNNKNLSDYNYVYFINSSCIGPFLPIYCKNKWYEYTNIFLEEYDLIGPVAEIPPRSQHFTNNPFIHTYMFGLNNVSYKIFFNLLNKYEDFNKFFCIYFERLFSFEILKNNLKIKSFLSLFSKIDLNNNKNWNSEIWNNTKSSCYEIPNNYFGIDLNPYEIIFIKNVRNINECRSSENAGISKILYNQINNYKKWLI